tara:strand:+ start:645 stop:1592 length:948 start_codon:yes stop_codon:yes gene_type:complete
MKGKFWSFFVGFNSSIFLFLIILILLGKDKITKYYYTLDFNLRRSFVNPFINKSKFEGSHFSSCLPELITHVPKESSIVIGHAYGKVNPKLIRKYLNPKVDRFLFDNREKIETLFLTGDVFNIPSLSKWDNLYSKYENHFDIFIAPGNHDVDNPYVYVAPGNNVENPYKDLFKLYVGNKQPIRFPFVVKKSGFNIVVDDSNSKKTLLDFEDIIAKFNKLDGDIIFLRHHVLINKLSNYGGSNNSLYKKEIFEKLLKNDSNIYFIYGNGGQYINKPRIACYVHNNFTHFLNGIGGFDDDVILIINKNKIYRYNLKN